MLKFFRKIRQNLLSENQFSKYLLYALGEILLVMIGILLALQVNNWHQNRLNRQIELKYLTNIKNDLVRDTALIQRLIIQRFDRKIEGLELAKSYARNQLQVQDTTDFLSKVAYGAVFANGIGFLRTGSYDELTSTGNLQLISNDSLKNFINYYYNFIHNQKSNVDYYISDYINFINSLKPFDDASPNYISPLDQQFMMKELKSTATIKKANLEITYGKAVKALTGRIHQRATELIQSVEKEIEK